MRRLMKFNPYWKFISLNREVLVNICPTIKRTNHIINIARHIIFNIGSTEGSKEERKILEVIDQANKFLSKGLPYQLWGKWELRLGENEAIKQEEPNFIFAGSETLFDDSQFDLQAGKVGVDNETITKFLIDNEVGTSATRTAQLQELKQSGILSSKIDNNSRIFTGDQRAFYLKVGYEYLKGKNGSGLELSREIKNSKTLDGVLEILNKFEQVNQNEFREFIKQGVLDYREAEKDLERIDELWVNQ